MRSQLRPLIVYGTEQPDQRSKISDMLIPYENFVSLLMIYLFFDAKIRLYLLDDTKSSAPLLTIDEYIKACHAIIYSLANFAIYK